MRSSLFLAISTIFLWFATRSLVKGAEEATRRSLRAYPGITGADIRIYGNDVRIRLTVQNFSTTPKEGDTGDRR